jgi:glucose-1-phosphate cytidylyltransferase
MVRMSESNSNENIKVVILAGGLGTRISEESHSKPKPMIEIGEKPIIWHIMKQYSYFGFNDFIICLGYKGEKIKEYFSHYYQNHSDMTIDLRNNGEIIVHKKVFEPWRVTLVDTGMSTMTGGRVKRIKDYIGNNTFMLTYGDGVSDINITKLLEFHRKHGKLATVTAVQPYGRFGSLDLAENSQVKGFQEKIQGDGRWINGGFFVMEPKVFDYIEGDQTVLEKEPLEKLANDGQLMAYKHKGFWHCMDTLRDKNNLEQLWNSDQAPWKLGG